MEYGSIQDSITVSAAGNYWLVVTDDHNCTGRDTVSVSLKDCLEGLYVANAFTPNDDGHNDRLTPRLFGSVESFHFQVYNRWGQVVFETDKQGTGWDGTFAGKKQDSNVFIWICTYRLKNQPAVVKRGSFVLIR